MTSEIIQTENKLGEYFKDKTDAMKFIWVYF